MPLTIVGILTACDDLILMFFVLLDFNSLFYVCYGFGSRGLSGS